MIRTRKEVREVERIEADICQDCWIEILRPFARIHE